MKLKKLVASVGTFAAATFVAATAHAEIDSSILLTPKQAVYPGTFLAWVGRWPT